MEKISTMRFEEVFEKYGKLVKYTIKKVQTVELDYEDLYSMGLVMLWKLSKTYDENLNYQFSTYFCKCFTMKIYSMLQDNRYTKDNESQVDDTSLYGQNGYIENNFKRIERKETIEEIITVAKENLRERNFNIVFDRINGKTFADIAESYNTSQTNVKRIYDESILKIRKKLGVEIKERTKRAATRDKNELKEKYYNIIEDVINAGKLTKERGLKLKMFLCGASYQQVAEKFATTPKRLAAEMTNIISILENYMKMQNELQQVLQRYNCQHSHAKYAKIMSPTRLEILILSEQGYTPAQIARQLNKKPSIIHSTMSKIRKSIKEMG